MQLVDHDTFLRQLAALFESSKEKGSVWITHKRLTHDGEDAAMAQADSAGSSDTQEYPCILKVTDGGKTNFSTKVVSSELTKFYAAYGSLLKAAMASLRKRDKKREKGNAEQAAKRKKRMLEPVKIDGPKRGGGRRKRQRQIKAAVKQQESQKKFKEREEARSKAQVVLP
ncbi:signal recognition particle, SRP9/SRP14 subunit [Ephemerocybe angulata]|uniref:Signal recognition particle subunit SRP14 n=1 Tax=Ephemerocybe angulata TaxID=980116 RepID=A0A8H6M5U8_9AGAR|nr:signal recognition particle, SRP9/SRP14 subunit [Tulosesus angulatus]